MARIVRCPSCAAMHRVLASQTQLLCDYCRSWIRCEQLVHVEELCLAGHPDRVLSERITREWLARQGVHQVRLHGAHAGMYALWHISSEAGEEIFLPATAESNPLLRKLQPSAAPMVEMSQRDPSLEPPELTLERGDAEQAALAAFADKDPKLSTIRLLWLPYFSFQAECIGGGAAAVHLLGSERPLLEPLPDRARALPAVPALLGGFGAFVTTLALIVFLTPSRAVGTVLLAMMLFATLPVWTRWATRRGTTR
jgi:hypothetical protein